MADSAAIKACEEAIAHAAKMVAKATDADEATKWQGIQNQQAATLAALKASA